MTPARRGSHLAPYLLALLSLPPGVGAAGPGLYALTLALAL
ncbi:MAG TPA: hypothetical protein VH877_13845 [Polyangia bacterium]|jgi:hypothetical protein|nr:hypothetical protein [Polyangia bacterium]